MNADHVQGRHPLAAGAQVQVAWVYELKQKEDIKIDVFFIEASRAAKRLYASTLGLQYSAFVSPYKCLRHIFMLCEY